jgi:hypothetical protein
MKDSNSNVEIDSTQKQRLSCEFGNRSRQIETKFENNFVDFNAASLINQIHVQKLEFSDRKAMKLELIV